MSDLTPFLTKEVLNLVLGEQLGVGVGRQVHVLGIDETKVVKLEQNAHSFQNVVEWETWRALKDTRHARWLAPCHAISQCGSVLVMTRVEPLTPAAERRRIPEWLTDTKRSNYGMLNGQLVCCDYGNHYLMERGAPKSKMKLPKWWDLTPSEKARANA